MRNYKGYVKFMEKAVAKKLPQASILNLGKLPTHLIPYRRNIPTLMHGSKIEFGTIFSSKNYNATRHIYFPEVFFKPLYSQALDLVIWTRISKTASEKLIESGGFDEYMLTVDPKYIECTISALIRRLVTEIYYSNNSTANKILEQTTPKDYYCKYVDREKVAEERARVNVPPEGRLKEHRDKFFKIASLSYNEEQINELKNAFKIFDSHLALKARKEIRMDPVQTYLKRMKDTEVKVELSGEVKLEDINCKELRGY